MTHHELKCWPDYFDAVALGRKTFEFRKDDRGFYVGDELLLREFDPTTGLYSGRECLVGVTYVARGDLIPDGFCAMSVKLQERNEP